MKETKDEREERNRNILIQIHYRICVFIGLVAAVAASIIMYAFGNFDSGLQINSKVQ